MHRKTNLWSIFKRFSGHSVFFPPKLIICQKKIRGKKISTDSTNTVYEDGYQCSMWAACMNCSCQKFSDLCACAYVRSSCVCVGYFVLFSFGCFFVSVLVDWKGMDLWLNIIYTMYIIYKWETVTIYRSKMMITGR